jgi:hypothetical protein
MSNQSTPPQTTPARVTLNGAEIVGTAHPLAPGRVLFTAGIGTDAELSVVGPAALVVGESQAESPATQ